MPLQRDLLVLPKQPQLRVEVVYLVNCRLKCDLSLLDANVQLSLLLEQYLKDCDIGVHIVGHVMHLGVG